MAPASAFLLTLSGFGTPVSSCGKHREEGENGDRYRAGAYSEGYTIKTVRLLIRAPAHTLARGASSIMRGPVRNEGGKNRSGKNPKQGRTRLRG